jgi:hypothetical protein
LDLTLFAAEMDALVIGVGVVVVEEGLVQDMGPWSGARVEAIDEEVVLEVVLEDDHRLGLHMASWVVLLAVD